QDLTSKIKEKHPNFYLIATALQEDAQVDSLFDNEDLDAISNPEMYVAMNDVFIKPDEPITNILQTYQKRDDDRSLLYVDNMNRSEEHTSELQSRFDLVCRLLLEK